MFVLNAGKITAPGCSRTDGILCGESRQRVRAALVLALPEPLSLDRETAETYAAHLEACTAVLSLNDYALYMSMMTRVVFNLKSNGGHIVSTHPVSKVCRLSHKRLRADTVHAQRDAVIEEQLQTMLRDARESAEKATQLAASVISRAVLTCPKCKTTEGITRMSEQLRSGDEGMTTRCMCKCGAKFRLAA